MSADALPLSAIRGWGEAVRAVREGASGNTLPYMTPWVWAHTGDIVLPGPPRLITPKDWGFVYDCAQLLGRAQWMQRNRLRLVAPPAVGPRQLTEAEQRIFDEVMRGARECEERVRRSRLRLVPGGRGGP